MTKISVCEPDEFMDYWHVMVDGKLVYKAHTEAQAWYYVLAEANQRIAKLIS